MKKRNSTPVGAVTLNANGYSSTKTSTGWRLTHHIIAEESLGRPLDTKVERCIFKDGDRTNLSPDNIAVLPKITRVNQTYDRRRNRLEELIEQFVDEADDKYQATEDLRDLLNDQRLELGFGLL